MYENEIKIFSDLHTSQLLTKAIHKERGDKASFQAVTNGRGASVEAKDFTVRKRDNNS